MENFVCIGTGSSDSSGAETPVHSPGSPHPPDRNSLLHTLYKDRGNSLSELRDSSFYCITQADGERPRSTSATVRSPLHHFRSTEDLDSIEATPPDLPPKRQQRFSMGDPTGPPAPAIGAPSTDLNPPPHPITFKQIIPRATLFLN